MRVVFSSRLTEMNGPYAYSASILPMLASALLMGALALYAWQHRLVPGAKSFAVVLLFIASWSIFTAIEVAATGEMTKIQWYKLEALAALAAMTALFYFALDHAGLVRWTTHRTVLLLSLVPLLGSALIATNDLHHLVWTRIWFDEFVHVERGPLNLLILAGGLLFVILAVLVFVWLSLQLGGVYREQALIFFSANMLPVLVFFLNPAALNFGASFYPVILSFDVSSLLYAVAIFRFGMLSVVPVGRDTAVELMADGALILDAQNRIGDLNAAAGDMLALPRRACVGLPVEQALAARPDLLRIIKEETLAGAEFPSDPGGVSRTYQVHISPLRGRNGFKLGQLILLQDVTEQKQARELLLQEQRSRAILQERESLARELHDSLGQTLAAAHLMTETARRLLTRGDAVQADECLGGIADMTLEAEADIREYLLGVRTVLSADHPFFPSLRDYLARFSRQYSLPVELNVAPRLEEQGIGPAVELQMLRVIQEALSNVRKHARARSVHVCFTIMGAHARVVIADDGQGFDPVPAAQGEGFGLRSMRERAKVAGGTLDVISGQGRGTQVVVTVPLAREL